MDTVYKLSAALSAFVMVAGISAILLLPEEDMKKEPNTVASGSAIRVEWDDHLWVEYTANRRTHLIHHPGCPCLGASKPSEK